MAKSLKDFVMAARAQITEINTSEFSAERAAGSDVLLVDVREPAEFDAGHIDGATSIPRGIIEPAADLEFPNRHAGLSAARARRVVVYCATGGRSAMAVVALQEMGFENVANLAGGISAWKEAGLAIKSK
jgi:rhodanese-related sulfurtransferase